VIRVGHKGADAIVPGNTLESFDAALAAGVDMIEFDVLSERPDGGGELRVVHDYGELRRHAAPTLAEALAHLCSAPFAGSGPSSTSSAPVTRSASSKRSMMRGAFARLLQHW